MESRIGIPYCTRLRDVLTALGGLDDHMETHRYEGKTLNDETCLIERPAEGFGEDREYVFHSATLEKSIIPPEG